MPHRIRIAIERLRGSLRRTNEPQLEDELQFHLEMETAENVRRGMSEGEAARAARKRFGSIAVTKESIRERRGIPLLGDLGRDLRYAVRALWRSPGFSIFAVLSLALGLGANIAIFSFFDTVVVRALPVPEPEALRVISLRGPRSPIYGFSYPEYRDYRDAATGVADVFAVAGTRNLDVRFLSGTGESLQAAEGVGLKLVSGNYFTGAGVRTIAGRVFSAEDDVTPGAHPVAVASYRFWRTRFAQRADVIGQQFRLNTTVFTVIGVAEPGFHGLAVGEMPDLWLPIAMQTQVDPGRSTLNSRNHSWLRLMARIRPGRSEEELQSLLAVQQKRSAEEEVQDTRDPDIRAMILERRLHLESGARGFGDLRTELSDSLLVLFGLAALVLLVACVNVANLLLARAAAREREIAIRLSLGAGRWRMMRQLGTESAALTVAGLAAGAVVSWGMLFWLQAAVERTSRETIPIIIDMRLVLFALGIATLTMLFIGLAPAWRPLRNAVTATLKEGSRSATASREHVWLRKALVLLQVAASVVLLIGATLLARTLYNLTTMDVGFERENVVTMGLSPRNSGYALPRASETTPEEKSRAEARLRQLYTRLETSVRAAPGVVATGYADCGFLTGCNGRRCCMVIPGVKLQGLNEKAIRGDLASPTYFAASGARIVLGRGFTEADNAKSAKVGVVNQTAARELFGNESPIGKEIGWEGRPEDTIRIVGVVADAKYSDLREETPRFLYTPFDQELIDGATLYVRTAVAPDVVIPRIRAAIDKVEPSLRVERIATAKQHLDRALVKERIVGELCGAFTALALLLAAVGLYGVMAFQVVRRTGEFGIRMALGAQQREILWGVLRESLLVGVGGIVAGVAVSAAVVSILSSLLYGVSAWDPATVLLAAGVVVIVAFVAGFLPARRASGIDPAIALRYE